MARDYKSKNIITKFVNKVIKKRSSTYDWLIKRFYDPKLNQENEPISSSNVEVIVLNERDDSFLFLLEGCAGPIETNDRYYWYKIKFH